MAVARGFSSVGVSASGITVTAWVSVKNSHLAMSARGVNTFQQPLCNTRTQILQHGLWTECFPRCSCVFKRTRRYGCLGRQKGARCGCAKTKRAKRGFRAADKIITRYRHPLGKQWTARGCFSSRITLVSGSTRMSRCSRLLARSVR